MTKRRSKVPRSVRIPVPRPGGKARTGGFGHATATSASQRFQEKCRQAAALFEHIEEPVFLHDRDFRILRCNRAYAAYAELSPDAIIGRPYWQVFPKRSGPLDGCRGILDGGPPEATEEFVTDSGEIFESHDINSYDEDGSFMFSRHLLRNVTSRRRYQEALELSSSFSDAVIGSAPGIFTVTDAQGRYIRWNKGLNAATGFSDEELARLSARELLAEEDKPKLAQVEDELVATGAAQGKMRVLTKGLGPRDYVYSARRFEVNGKNYVVRFALDRTDVEQIESELQREKAFSDAVIESAPGIFYVIDQQANLVRWNSTLKNQFAAGDDELHGRSVLTFIHEEDRALAAAKVLAAFATGYSQGEARVLTATQGMRTFFKTARRFYVSGVPYLAGFGIDISERKQAEEWCEREKCFADALIESVPGAFYVIDTEGNYFRWNSYLNRLTGLSDEQLRHTPSLLSIHEDERPLAAATMRQAFETGYAQAELRVLTHDRGVRVFLMSARRFQVGNASYLAGVGVDTTDRIAKAHELEHEARTDPLTGVSNRSHFIATAAQEFARCRRYGHPLSLWMLDIDHFKNVNDTYGHHAGDIVLGKFIALSRQTLRDWDVIGRMGGEEFAVLLPETDADQALLVAERLRQAIAGTPIAVDEGRSIRINVSIGVATQCDDDATFALLLDRADRALYEAKRTGRDKVCVAERPLAAEKA